MSAISLHDALFQMIRQDPDLAGAWHRGGAVFRLDGLHPAFRGWTVEQTFRPTADRLKAAGMRVTRRFAGNAPMILVAVTRHKEETYANVARAWQHLSQDGHLIVAGSNDLGGKSIAKLVEKVLSGLPVRRVPMRKSTVLIARKTDAMVPPSFAEWLAADRLSVRVDGRFLTQPGVFSWKGADKGSTVLLRHLPEQFGGRVADLGAGWGYLSDGIAARLDEGGQLDLYEAEWKALQAARANLAGHRDRLRIRYRWVDVARWPLPRRVYDAVVTNPPFHDGAEADPALGQSFLSRASEMLKLGGVLYAVANRHLPYEAVLGGAFAKVETLAEEDGYKVFRAMR